MSEKSPSIEQVRTLIPIVRKDFWFSERKYNKLTLRNKGYYDLIKEYGLLEELYNE